MNCGRDGHRTAVVVLAAGSSKRFGEDKMLTDFDGKPLILHSVGNAIASDAESVIAVVNEGRGPIVQKLPRGVIVAVNHNPSMGLSSSIIAGLSAIGSDCITNCVQNQRLSVKIRKHLVFPESLRRTGGQNYDSSPVSLHTAVHCAALFFCNESALLNASISCFMYFSDAL